MVTEFSEVRLRIDSDVIRKRDLPWVIRNLEEKNLSKGTKDLGGCGWKRNESFRNTLENDDLKLSCFKFSHICKSNSLKLSNHS